MPSAASPVWLVCQLDDELPEVDGDFVESAELLLELLFESDEDVDEEPLPLDGDDEPDGDESEALEPLRA